jgi:hypothetical protein
MDETMYSSGPTRESPAPEYDRYFVSSTERESVLRSIFRYICKLAASLHSITQSALMKTSLRFRFAVNIA